MAPKRSKGKTAFVTVGTTKFDALIRAVDSPQVVEALRQRGFTRLQIQLGSGFYLPTVLCGSSNHAVLPGGFEVGCTAVVCPALAYCCCCAAMACSSSAVRQMKLAHHSLARCAGAVVRLRAISPAADAGCRPHHQPCRVWQPV